MPKAKVKIAQISKNRCLTDRYEVIDSPRRSIKNDTNFPKVGTRLSLDEFKLYYPSAILLINMNIHVAWDTGEQKKF